MACPLCGAPPSSPVERHGRFSVHLCAGCDLQFADPLEEAGRDFYEQHTPYCGPEALYASPRALNWDQRCFLRDRPRPGGALLDIGCGVGHFAEAARRAGYRVTGLELSRSQLELARRRFGRLDLHAAPLAEYSRDTAPGRFDVATAFQVLEHVADPQGFVADVRRLLRPGGYVAIGVPNWRMWDILRDPMDAPPNHLTRWSSRSLTQLLGQGGFEVVRLREHRSVYGALLRHLRLGLLRRLMSGSGPEAPAPRQAVLAASVAKTRVLMAIDLWARGALALVRAPGVALYALARAPG